MADAAAVARAASAPVAPLLSERDFEDTEKLYRSRSTGDLLFNYSILRLCSVPAFVRAAPHLFDALSRVPLVSQAVLATTKHTFYKQFCSGESIEGSKPALQALARSGIGSILEYVHVCCCAVAFHFLHRC